MTKGTRRLIWLGLFVLGLVYLVQKTSRGQVVSNVSGDTTGPIGG